MANRITCWKLSSKGEVGSTLVARFATRRAAEDAKPVAGGYPVIMREDIVIYNSAVEFNPGRFDKEARQSALDKLTEREKIALDVRPE